jgi:hypothetical protein
MSWDLNALGTPLVAHVADVEDTAAELAMFRALERFLVGNPRQLKRLVNLHRLVKILLYPPGGSRPPTDDAQRKLVKWLVFCERWWRLVDDVLSRAAKPLAVPEDCLAGVASDLGDTEEGPLLHDFAKTLDSLMSDDLAPGGILDQAAWVSQLVEEEPEVPEAVAPSGRAPSALAIDGES